MTLTRADRSHTCPVPASTCLRSSTARCCSPDPDSAPDRSAPARRDRHGRERCRWRGDPQDGGRRRSSSSRSRCRSTRLTVGQHTQAGRAAGRRGQRRQVHEPFAVTTSFDDLATVIDQYADNALRTTLNGASAVGATGLRFAVAVRFPGRSGRSSSTRARTRRPPRSGRCSARPPHASHAVSAGGGRCDRDPARELHHRYDAGGPNAPTSNGPVAGQPIVLDTGANLEVISVSAHIVPVPAAPAPNVVLSAPLAKDHAAGRRRARPPCCSARR